MKSIIKNGLLLTSLLVGSQAFSQTQPKATPMKQEPLKRTEIATPPKKFEKKGVVVRKAAPAKRELTPIPIKKED